MDKILQMKQKRAGIIKKMRELLNGAETAQRSLSEDEQKEYDNYRSEAMQLADSIVREEEMRSLESSVPPQSSPVAQRKQEEKLEAGIRAARFVKVALLASRSRDESFDEIAERMYPQDEYIRAAMVEGTPGDGGYMIPQNLYNEIIPLLRQTGVTRSMGITELPLPNGNLNLVKQTGAANFKWVGENQPIGNSKVTLGSIKLNAKKLAGIIPISNELLLDASMAADRFVRDELVSGIAEAEDITSLYGTGSENAPKGITVACAANKITVNGKISAAVIYQMVGKILSVKLTNPNLGWRIPGVLWADLYGMQTENGSYIFKDEMKDGKLCGYPFKIDNNITVGSDENGLTQIFFGDWKHFLIGTAGALQISISQDASYTDGGKQVSAFENDLTLMRGILREDFGVRYEEAFVFADAIHTKGSAAAAAFKLTEEVQEEPQEA